MYERQVEVLGQICSSVFQGMTSTDVVQVISKRDQRADARYTLAFHIKYENIEKRVEGKFTLGFTESEMAVAVAAPLAETLGLEPPTDLDDVTLELLSEFLNTVVGHAVAAWDKTGFKVRFHPPGGLPGRPFAPSVRSGIGSLCDRPHPGCAPRDLPRRLQRRSGGQLVWQASTGGG